MTWDWVRALAGRTGDRNDLEERFVFADHAEVGPCALFRCINALLEIDNLGVQRRVAFTQRIVESALLSDSKS